MTTITKILDLFLTFNYVEGSDSLNFEHSEYNDDFFRWTNNSFKHNETFSIVFNDNRILMFKKNDVRERLGANQEKIKSNPERTKFGCNIKLVKDLILSIPITELSDDDIKDIESNLRFQEEKQAEAVKRLLEKEKSQSCHVEMKLGREKGSKLTNKII